MTVDPEYGLMAPQRRDQLTFDAFCETHERAWLATARASRLSDEQARAVVDTVRDQLWGDWQLLLREPVPAASAWRVLKDRIAQADPAAAAADGEHGPPEPWRAAIGAVIDRMRLTLESAPDLHGVDEAIRSLPERQQDVVMLRFALDLPEETVADYLDSTVATVRSQARHARTRLGEKLGRRNA
ncbi:RNA polymerase sigma factor [Kitasatospora sp. NPDC059646]|uniref:RNA polymerase sigma factor n=1 Tax=Kitasatospora sp. NPDC059646 TaxID=3346893 RepID=UPI00368C6244